MNTEIISVGTELLLGHTVNTDARDISEGLAELGINVLDISQTILQDYFTMVMSVDLAACTASFGDVKDILSALGDEMGLVIRIQRTEIFDAMYKI